MILDRLLVRAVSAFAGAVLRGGPRGRLSILLYHRVLAAPDPLLGGDPDTNTFRAQMALLKNIFNVLPLSEAIERLQSSSLPARAVCVSFDDGYRDNAELALPILSELGVPGTFFIATGYLDNGRMFNDSVIEAVRQAPEGNVDLTALQLGRHTITDLESRKRLIRHVIESIKYRRSDERARVAEQIAEHWGVNLPNNLMMSSQQVRELTAAGMEIGGHTVTHPILAEVPDGEAEREIRQGREELAALTGQPLKVFAYPNGKPGTDYFPRHPAMVEKAGFAAAVSTAWGVSTRETHRYRLARFTPWDRELPRFALRMVQNGLRPLRNAAQ